MHLIARAGEALAGLGRQGTRAMAVSIFVGLALPPLAAAFKLLVAPAIFVLLVLAFLRVDPAALRGEFARPLPVLLATIWIMAATPLALGAVYALLGDGIPGELKLALVLQAAAPPIITAPAVAAILGLDAALALAALIASTVVTPLSAPLFAELFAGEALPLDAAALALRLGFFLGGSFLTAAVIRHRIGRQRVLEAREHIDGLNMIALVVFAIALMESVSARLLGEPGLVLALLALSFGITFGLMALTALVFSLAGIKRSLALGWASGNRNMGVMLAVAAGLPDLVWLYFALAQFPIYLGPQLMAPLVRRLLRSRLPAG
jgi:BASS family bile acid:Na+ symporter